MAAYQRTSGAEQGVLLLKFKRGTAPVSITRSPQGLCRTGVQAIDDLGSQLSVQSIERVFPRVERSEDRAQKHGLDLWYRVTYDPSKASLRSAVDNYSAIEELDWVETVKRAVFSDGTTSQWAIPVDQAQMESTRADGVVRPFNDPYLSRQWWFDSQNTIVDGVHPKAGIGMAAAWAKCSGTNQVIVAVMDGGVKWLHEDLADNMWVNAGEVPYDKIDNDGNGYTDDVNGFDFYTAKIENAEIEPHDHGTHVAGIIAAVNNNGKGMSSIAGGSGNKDGVRIMTCQLFKGVRSTGNDKIAQGIKYAADNGAVICQNSWGFPGPDERSKVVEEAIDYFIAQAGNEQMFPQSLMRGGLVIFASGNLAHEIGQTKVYPQAYQSVIAVSCTDEKRQRSGFACYGDWVEIAAPGGRDPGDDNLDDIKQFFIISTIATGNFTDNKTYGYFQGTSQACPMVSAVAALLIQTHPGQTAAQIKELLLSSVSSMEDTEKDFALMGRGFLDASKHILPQENAEAPEVISDLQLLQDKNHAYSLQWTVPVDKNGDWIDTYILYVGDREITNATVSSAKTLVFTQFNRKSHGQTIKIDLVDSMGVDMKTNKYFCVASTDQWGNLSQRSSMVVHMIATDNPLILPAGAAAASVLSMRWPIDFKGQKTIKVYDRSARLVIKRVVEDHDANQYNLQVEKLASGNYTVEVSGDNGTYSRNFRKI